MLRGLLFFVVLSSGLSFAHAQTSYHCNGGYRQSGSTWYHANGGYFVSGSTSYHLNGGYLKSGSTLYHANGGYFVSGSTFYHANGGYLKSGSTWYHASGGYLKSGSSCYYENGGSMGQCPRTYEVSNDLGANGRARMTIDFESGTVTRYEVTVAGNGFVETYAIDLEGQVLELTSSCSGGGNGELDQRTVDSILGLFNQSNTKTKDAVKALICR